MRNVSKSWANFVRNWNWTKVRGGLVGVAVASASCACDLDATTAAVGDACLPRDEFSPNFSGFAVDEITVETANVDCAAESFCLVRGFQGRVSCPYGQDESALSMSTENPQRCYLPRDAHRAVTVPVSPQLKDARASESVYCSALCADAHGHRADGRRYHDCPSGYRCEAILESGLLGGQNLNGSYCVREDTPTKNERSSAVCQRDATGKSGDCGSAFPKL
ncbi:MAG: hypothetical protein QM784_03295 [Polyangiaceae bacterium]